MKTNEPSRALSQGIQEPIQAAVADRAGSNHRLRRGQSGFRWLHRGSHNKRARFTYLLGLALPLACAIQERELKPGPPPGGDGDGAGYQCEDPLELWGEHDPYFASYERTKGDCTIQVPGKIWNVNADVTEGDCKVEERSILASGCGLSESQICTFEDGGVAQYSYVLKQSEDGAPIAGTMTYSVTAPGGIGDCEDEYELTLASAELPHDCRPYDDWDGDYYRFAERLTGQCADLESETSVDLDLDSFPDENCVIIEESTEDRGCGYTLRQQCDESRFHYAIEQDAPGGIITALYSLSVEGVCESTYRIQYWPL